MKKLFLITIMLLSTLVCARHECSELGYSNTISSHFSPVKSGTYYAIDNDLKYSDGTNIEVGNFFSYTAWEDAKWYNSHWISCKITDIVPKKEYNEYWQKYEYCYLLTLDCTVQERAQFYNANYTASITYTELKGHRSDGTLKWSRDSIGSTDIYCYDRNGMTIIKHVNNPYRCK